MTPPGIDAVSQRIRQHGIIAIVRGRFSSRQVVDFGEALARAGIAAMEVTLNSPDALAHIVELKSKLKGNILIGAGTVRTPAHVDQAIEAGAEFLISPGLDADSVKRSLSKNILHLPGVFTATEAQSAAALGCKLLKLFPADTLSPIYLKALRAPLDDIDLVPTGGVSVENIGQWRRSGAAAVALGSSLISSADQSPEDVFHRATALKSAWEAARG